jgi:hypothetical protein
MANLAIVKPLELRAAKKSSRIIAFYQFVRAVSLVLLAFRGHPALNRQLRGMPPDLPKPMGRWF